MEKSFSKSGLHLSIWTVEEFIGVLEDLRRLNPDVLLSGDMTIDRISYSRKKLLESKMRDPDFLAIALRNRNLA